MIIAFRSRLSLDDLFSFAFWGILLLSGLFFLYFLFALMKTPVIDAVSLKRGSVSALNGAKIFTGPLALRENERSPLAISLEQKLILLAQSMRPDARHEERVFCIGVQGTDQRQVIKEGETIYAQVTKHPSGAIESIAFSDEGLPMVPHVLDERSVLLKVNDMEVLVTSTSKSPHKNTLIPGIDVLANAKWWGSDLLFEKYGGEEYLPLSRKQKLEIAKGNSSYMVFAEAGDFLSFSGGKWVVLETLKDGDRYSPLAYVQAVTDGTLSIEAWDQEGFPVLQEDIKLQPKGSFRVASDKLLTDSRMRSAKQISCQMEKKRLILKEGDWLVKGKSGWSKLKTLSEIEGFLSHEQTGELLIIDSIDPRGHLKGSYFDEKRVHLVPIAIAIQAQPQQQKPSVRSRVRRHLSKL